MHPIRINTTVGISFFDDMLRQMKAAKFEGRELYFKQECLELYHAQCKELETFLDDDVMARKFKMNEEDKAGFKLFNEQSDACSILKYFGGKYA